MRSPVIMAAITLFVLLSLNGMAYMRLFMLWPNSRMCSGMREKSAGTPTELFRVVSPTMHPHPDEAMMISAVRNLPSHLLWDGCIRSRTEVAVNRKKSKAGPYEDVVPKNDVIRIPAVNGKANPAMSLSTVISLLFFAKVVIILLTLQGCR